jgi:ATP-binding cassette subfamily F protein 3
MHSCDLLIDALTKYEGSIILVSHDRYFVSKTANKIWEIVNHEIKEFKGGYEEWVAWKERMAKQAADAKKAETGGKKLDGKVQKANKPSEPVKPAETRPQPSTAINKEDKKELQRMQKQFQQLEEQLARLNQHKKELDNILIDPATYSEKTKFLETEASLKKVNEELNRLNKQYEEVFEKIMELESKM